MTPLADAVRFVNSQQLHDTLANNFHKLRLAKTLGSDVQQRVLSCTDIGIALLTLGSRQRRIDEGGRDPTLAKCIHLVLHQCDQWRDHQRQCLLVRRRGVQQCRHLVTKRLAHARGHDYQRMLPRQDVANHFLLRAAKGGEAKMLLERVERLHPSIRLREAGQL